MVLSVAILGLKYFQPKQLRVVEIPCNNGVVKIIVNKEILIIDPGCIGSKISAEKWINYTLIPALIQNFGTSTVDHLILLQPSIITFEAFSKTNSLTIKNVYLPTWNGSLKTLNYHYMQLCSRIKKQNGTIIRTGKQTKKIVIDDLIATIEPLEKELSYKEITYPALTVILKDRSGTIDQIFSKAMV